MTKNEFSLMVIKKKVDTGEDYIDIIIKYLEDEHFPVFFDNVKNYIDDNLKSKLWEECKRKKLIKENYYKRGLYRIIGSL